MFTFDNILLPDSSVNEMASHGYVRYQIQHRDGLPEETYVQNTAGIYFDFNPPVITNTVENILVSQYPLLLISTPPSCYGDSDGSVGVLFDLPFYDSYAWSTGGTGTSIDSLEAGTYSLTVQLSNGAQIDTVFTLIEPSELVMASTMINDVSCFGGMDGVIQVNVAGGTPSYTYEWNNGFDGDINMSLVAGDYSVSVIRRLMIPTTFDLASLLFDQHQRECYHRYREDDLIRAKFRKSPLRCSSAFLRCRNYSVTGAPLFG